MAIDAIGGVHRESVPISFRPEVQVPEMNSVNIQLNPLSGEKSASESEGQKGKDAYPNDDRIKSAISQANNKIRTHKTTRCEFSYHEATNRVSIKVMDKDTEEVLREIPPEETLEMLEKMLEMAGILIDEKR